MEVRLERNTVATKIQAGPVVLSICRVIERLNYRPMSSQSQDVTSETEKLSEQNTTAVKRQSSLDQFQTTGARRVNLENLR